MLGFPEMLEFLPTVADDELEPLGSRAGIEAWMLTAARASCDFFIENTPTDPNAFGRSVNVNRDVSGDHMAFCQLEKVDVNELPAKGIALRILDQRHHFPAITIVDVHDRRLPRLAPHLQERPALDDDVTGSACAINDGGDLPLAAETTSSSAARAVAW